MTIAIGGGFRSQELLREVRSNTAYESLTDTEWNWVLDFIVRGGASLDAYPEFKRVEREEDFFHVTQRRLQTSHRMNIGTIVADASMHVKYLKGKTLGTAEESFLSKLKPQEKFLFAGKLVEMVTIRDNIAYVRRAKGTPDTVPRWMGGRMPLSSELSEALREKLHEASRQKLVGREMNALKGLLDIQQRWSIIPQSNQLLIEQIKTRTGYQIFIFPFEGRLVHEGLAALTAYRISRNNKTTFSMACNDYGIVLQSHSKTEIDPDTARVWFSTDNLVADILESMNCTEMAKRQFRQIARIAGLIQQGLSGGAQNRKQLQASSNLFFDVFCQYDPDNLLLEQSRREVLDQQLEASRMHMAMERISQSQIMIQEPPRVTPLAFPLLVVLLRERVSSETLADRIARMQMQLEAAAVRTGK